MSFSVNENHLGKGSGILCAAVTMYDGVNRIAKSYRNDQGKTPLNQRIFQVTAGSIEIIASLYLGKESIKTK